MSCEAVREINTYLPYHSSASLSLNETLSNSVLDLPKPAKFNAIQWYNGDRTQLLSVKFSTIQLSSNLINYTSLFPYENQNETSLIKENSNYQCCTVLNGDIVNCQTFLAQVYNPLPYLPIEITTNSLLNNNYTVNQKIQELDASLEENTTTTTNNNNNSSLLSYEEHIGKLFNFTSSSIFNQQQDQLKMSTNAILGQQINYNQQTEQQATTYPSKFFGFN